MSEEQIKVGTVLVFDGVENLAETIKAISSALGSVADVFKNGKAIITVDDKALKHLGDLTSQLATFLSEVKTVLKKPIKIELDDTSIKKMKDQLEAVFAEVLSRTRQKGNTSSGDTKRRGSGFSDSANLPGLANDLQSYEKDINSAYQNIVISVSELLKSEGDQIKQLSRYVGREVLQGIGTFRIETGKEFQKGLREIQKDSGRLIAEISKQISLRENLMTELSGDPDQTGTIENTRREISVLEESKRTIGEVISQTEIWRQSTADVIASQQNLLKIEEKLQVRQGALNRLFAEAGGNLQSMIETEDISRLSTFTDRWRKLGLQITLDIKSFQKESDKLSTVVKGNQNRLEDLQQSLISSMSNRSSYNIMLEKEIALHEENEYTLIELVDKEKLLTETLKRQEEVRRGLNSKNAQTFQDLKIERTQKEIESVRKEIDITEKSIDSRNLEMEALREAIKVESIAIETSEKLIKATEQTIDSDLKAKKILEQKIEQYHNYGSEVKNVLEFLRVNERVFAEELKLVERAQRNYHRLEFSVKSFGATFDEVYDRISSGQSGRLDIDNAKRTIEETGRLAKTALKSIGDLEAAQKSTMGKINRDFESRSGLFANFGMDDAGQKAAEEFRDSFINSQNKYFGELIQNQRNKLDQLNQLTGSDKFVFIEQFIEASKETDKLDLNLDKLIKKIQNLDIRNNNLTMFPPNSSQGIIAQAELIKKLESEYEQLNKDIFTTTAEISRLKTEGVADVSALEAKLKELMGLRRQLQGNLSGSSVNRDETVINADLFKKGSDAARKYQSDIISMQANVRASLARLNQGGDVGMQGAQDLKKLSSEAKSAYANIDRLVALYEDFTNRGGQLSKEQAKELEMLKLQAVGFREVSKSVDKNKESIDRAEKAYRNLGQRFSLYSSQVADTIKQSLSFVNAMTIVSTVLFSIQGGFREVMQESKALSRTMTVMESSVMTSQETFDRLKTSVREVAIEMGESVSDVAEVAKQIGSAGFTAEESLRALAPTMKLVVATSVDSEVAARAVVGIYRVYGEQIKTNVGEAKAFAKINDVLSSVYKNHTAEIDELANGFKFSSSAAKLAGFTFEENAAFLAVLNDNMIKSGEAGRGLQVIFAQLAAKSDKFGQLFGIDLDKTKPLRDQFLTVLREVNQQVATGELSIKELEKRFEIFGLRGARSFAVLTEKYKDVEKAFDELNNKATGLTDTLAGIVTGELDKQFQSAKQALLDFAREGAEPLKDLVVSVSTLIKSVRDVYVAFQLFDGKGTGIAVMTIALILAIQTGLAMSKVIATLLMEIKALGLGIGSTTKDMYNAARSSALFQRQLKSNAIEMNYLTASTLAGGVAVDKYNKANFGGVKTTKDMAAATAASGLATAGLSRGIGALAVRALGMFGTIGLIISAVSIVIGLFSSWNDSSRALNKDLGDLALQVKSNSDEIKKLDTFNKELNKIDEAMKNTAISADGVGQSVKNAFDKVGPTLITQANIIGKTNKEIAESFALVRAEAEKQANLMKFLKEKENLEKRNEMVKNLNQQLMQDYRLTASFTDKIFGGDSLQTRVKSFGRYERLAGDQLAQDVSGIDNETLQKERTKAAKALEVDVQKFIEIKTKLVDALGPAEAAKEVEKLYKLVGDKAGVESEKFIRDRVKQIESGFSNKINIPSVINLDEFEQTAGVLYEVVSLLDAPMEPKLFNSIRSGMLQVKEEASLVRRSILEINKASDIRKKTAFTDTLPKNEQEDLARIYAQRYTFRRATLEKVVNDYMSKSLNDNNERQAFVKDLADKGLVNAIDPKAIIGDKEIKNITSDIFDRFSQGGDKYVLTGRNISGVTQIMAESTKDATGEVDKLRQSLVGIFAEGQVEEKLQQLDNYYDSIAKSFRAAILSQTNLNEVISKRLQIEQFRQLRMASDDAGKSVTEFTRRLAEALKARGQFVDQIADNDLDVKSRENASEEVKKLDQQINDLKSRLQLEADYIKAQKELRIIIQRNTNNTIRENTLQRQIEKNFQSTLASKYEELRINIQNLQLKKEEDILQERLKGSLEDSREALNEYVKLQSDLIKLEYEIHDALRESTKMRFDTLADIDQILDKNNKTAGAQYKIVGALTQVADINRRLNAIQGRGVQNDEEKVKLYRELVDVAKDVFAIQDQIKKNEEKVNDLLNKRAELLKKIRDEYGDQSSKFEADLKKVLENRFSQDSLDTALKLSKALNIDYKNVFAKPEEAINNFIAGVKSGRLDIRAFGEDLGFIGDNFKELSDSQAEFNRRFLDVQQNIRGKSLLDFERFLALNKFDDAEKALDRYTSSVEASFKDKNPTQYLEGLEKSLELQERLSRKIGKENEAIKFQFELIGDKNVLMFFDEFANRLKVVKKELLEMSNLKMDNIPGTLQGSLTSEDNGFYRDKEGYIQIKSELREIEKTFNRIRFLLESYGMTSNNYTPARLPGYKDGGKIPGYGGGDKVMAMLEQGEFIMPKEMVKKFGPSFFESLRNGRLPGYQQGGVVNMNLPRNGDIELTIDLGEDVVDSMTLTAEQVDAAAYELKMAGEEINLAVKGMQDNSLVKFKNQLGEYISKALEKFAVQNPSTLGVATSVVEIPAKIRDALARNTKERSTEKTKVPVDRLGAISDTAKKLREELEKSPIDKFMFEGIMDGIDKVKDYFTSFLSELFVPEFAKANAEVYEEFLRTSKEIQKTYEESFDTAITGLQRNETAYYDYLNAIEQAENERTKARMQAEQQYRDSLIKTSQVFRDSLVGSVEKAFSTLGTYSDKFFTAASESLFGSMEDNAIITFSFLKKGLGDALGAAGGAVLGGIGAATGLSGSGAGEAISSFLTEGVSGAIAQSVGSVVGSSIASLSSLIVGSLGQLVSFSTGDGNANNVVKFLEKFAEELPEKATEFINTMVENADLIISAIAESAPTIIDTLVQKLPELLEGLIAILSEALPKILGAIAKSLPTLIRGLIPQLMSLLGLVISQVPTIIEAIASSIPLIIGELIKALPKLIPAIIGAIIKGVVALVWGLIRGVVGIFGLDLPALTFHKGGVIPGNKKDMMINAQSGEGVLSRQGLAALGGADNLNAFNRGINPFISYDSRSIVSDSTNSRVVPSNNYSNVNNSSSSSNSTNYIIQVNGNDSDEELRRKGKIQAQAIDEELAKMNKDKKSKLSRSMRDSNRTSPRR